jgi:hypothetical protein
MVEILAAIRGEDSRGKFHCGIVLWDDRVVEVAPKVKYMKGWTRDRVRNYCRDREWQISVVWEMARCAQNT